MTPVELELARAMRLLDECLSIARLRDFLRDEAAALPDASWLRGVYETTLDTSRPPPLRRRKAAA